MKKGKLEVVFVIDRSGSMGMGNKVEETMKAYNDFIEDQKKLDGECYVTFYRFDDEFEKVFELKDIQKLSPVEYDLIQPRGMTSLYDAIGKAINDVGNRLRDTDESERPEKVLLSVITDGGENNSSEFKKSDVKEMIERQENKYNWTITFLSEDLSAVNDSRTFMSNTSNTMGVGTMSKGLNKMSGYTTMLRSSGDLTSYDGTLEDVEDEDDKMTDEDLQELKDALK